jgi:hypothetical protein
MTLSNVIVSPPKEEELSLLASSSSSSCSTAPSSPPLEDNEQEHERTVTKINNDTLCDEDHLSTLSVLEGLLLCGGNYGLEETAQSVHLLPLNDGEAREMVPPLPLFFATRFRTVDAERSAQPTVKRRQQQQQQVAFSAPADPCYSDWYDMFAWLTMGASTEHDTKSLSWNGHLSLGPDQPSRRRRRRIMAALMSRKQPSSSLDQENVNPQLQRMIRPLPIIPVNQPGHEDWEMIFLSVCQRTPAF